ncbi:hypothetical protein QJS10_CPA03g00590 [Acorus calamus]|uniref:Phosphatidic acid phosphatase type 2/haloperoxidase domain-containing protein n=1 Tax=Acorus calamus TaxID=4465 RepID=A0AAV9F680_ACOCL|nr:hypothetical protein QJS10_CPA03g00590 [Acorus calamus]
MNEVIFKNAVWGMAHGPTTALGIPSPQLAFMEFQLFMPRWQVPRNQVNPTWHPPFFYRKTKVFDHKGHVSKLCLVFLPLLVAALVGISRVNDYWHHWEDVFAGGLLGIVVATLCYLQFFPAPYHENGWGTYAYFRMLEETGGSSRQANTANSFNADRTSTVTTCQQPQNSNSILEDLEAGRSVTSTDLLIRNGSCIIVWISHIVKGWGTYAYFRMLEETGGSIRQTNTANSLNADRTLTVATHQQPKNSNSTLGDLEAGRK